MSNNSATLILYSICALGREPCKSYVSSKQKYKAYRYQPHGHMCPSVTSSQCFAYFMV
jgi:hypothetical protein